MTAREDAIEAGAKAIGAHRKGYGWERDDETWKNYVTLMEWAVDAVEPIIRADERERIAEKCAARYEEAKRAMRERGYDAYLEGQMDAYDNAERITINEGGDE